MQNLSPCIWADQKSYQYRLFLVFINPAFQLPPDMGLKKDLAQYSMKKINESYENCVVTKVVILCKARLKAMSMQISYSSHFQ